MVSGELKWIRLLDEHWPKVYRFLAKAQVQYHIQTMLPEELASPFGRTRKLHRFSVELLFHPGLLEASRNSLLVGTLLHEGIHAMLVAIRDDLGLPTNQVRRLAESHWVGNCPDGYGELLFQVHGRPDEIGVELLTNKILIQHGMEPLVRNRKGEYV